MDGMSQMTYASLAGMELPHAPAHQLDDINDPARLAARRAEHARSLRKLQTAIHSAITGGATWAEIRDAIEQAIPEAILGDTGRFSAIARAKVHDGDDSF